MDIRVRRAGPFRWVGFVVTGGTGVFVSTYTRWGAYRAVKKELRAMGIKP